jgi:hypothetical protein
MANKTLQLKNLFPKLIMFGIVMPNIETINLGKKYLTLQSTKNEEEENHPHEIFIVGIL